MYLYENLYFLYSRKYFKWFISLNGLYLHQPQVKIMKTQNNQSIFIN